MRTSLSRVKTRSRKSGRRKTPDRPAANSGRSPKTDRTVHYVFGPAAAALRRDSTTREKPKPAGFELRAAAIKQGSDDFYVILKHRSTGEFLLMTLDTSVNFFRPIDAFGNLLKAGADDKWHEPLLKALIGADKVSTHRPSMEATARSLREYFRRYEHLVASLQLFPSISTGWASHEFNTKLRNFALRHVWDGTSYRQHASPAEVIPYTAGVVSNVITDVKEWYEKFART